MKLSLLFWMKFYFIFSRNFLFDFELNWKTEARIKSWILIRVPKWRHLREMLLKCYMTRKFGKFSESGKKGLLGKVRRYEETTSVESTLWKLSSAFSAPWICLNWISERPKNSPLIVWSIYYVARYTAKSSECTLSLISPQRFIFWPLLFS